MAKKNAAQEKDILDLTIEKFKSVFWYVVLFSFATNALVLVLPIFSLQVLDRVISSGSYATLGMLTIVALGSFIFLSLFGLVRTQIQIRLAEWMDQELHSKVLAKTIALASIRPGTSGSQNVRDLSTIKSFLTGQAINSFIDAPWAIIFIIVVFLIHPLTGFVTLFGGLMLLGLALVNELVMRKLLAEANEKSVHNMIGLEQAARNAEVIEAMGMQSDLIRRWDAKNQEVSVLQSLASGRANVVSSISKTVRMCLQVVIIATGAYLALNHSISVGGIIACSILAGRALAPFESAISSWSSYTSFRKSWVRLKEMVRNIPERSETISLPAPKGVVMFDKVIFAHPGGKPVLKGVTFTLSAGDSLGVIGPSAAGKSTLAKLLVGIWQPGSGSVRLDGADVYTWRRSEFGSFIGYLPQDVELFSGTVRDNIARMKEDAKDEEVIAAARMAEAHELILQLPNGYDTQIGAGGAALSAGQRQRVGLARAFFGKPKLLVLDEPNSNLDDAGESALAAAIRNAKQHGITTVVVSHRTGLLQHVDYIMVMKEGMISDFGSMKDMMAKFAPRVAGPAAPQITKQQAPLPPAGAPA
jgi:ATP-binding cassette subfamily B protein